MATNEYLQKKIAERASNSALVQSIQQTAADGKRDLEEHEIQQIDAVEVRNAKLDGEIEKLVKAGESSAKFLEMHGAYDQAQTKAQQAWDRQRDQQQQQLVEQRLSLGQKFTASEQFKEYGGRGTSRDYRLEGNTVERLEVRSSPAPDGTPIMSGQFGETPSMLWPGPTMPALRTALFDVISRVPTTMGSVQYYYWFQNPSDAASQVAEGQPKPEAPLQGDLVTVPIATYAWWKAITRQALDDIPLIQSVIDTQLQTGIVRAINNAAADALASDTNIAAAAGGTGLLGQIRVAIAQIDEIGYTANALLLNPMDWADLDTSMFPVLQRNTGTPFGPSMQSNFWGLRPVAVPQIPAGTAYVGDFSEGMTYFDRQSTSLLMTDSHADNFVRNVLVLLAEARGAVAVTNAATIIKCTGSADGGEDSGGAAENSGSARSASARKQPPPPRPHNGDS